MSFVDDNPDEQSSLMFSPIKVNTPPPPAGGRRGRARKRPSRNMDLIHVTPAPTVRACIKCGKKAGQCKCAQAQTSLVPSPTAGAAAAAAKEELWHLDVDNWQTKHSTKSKSKSSSSSDYFNVQEKADLRRWFESLSRFSEGCISSHALIFQLISSNIISDEKGLRLLLQHDKSPPTFTFYSFIAVMEKSQTNTQYRQQLKHLVALARPKSKGGLLQSVPVVVAERRRKKLLDGMIHDTARRQGEVDSVFDQQDTDTGTGEDSHSHSYSHASANERQQKRDELRLKKRLQESQKHMDSYIDTVQQVIDDDRSALSLAKQQSKKQQLFSIPISLQRDLDSGSLVPPSPLAPVLWGEHGLDLDAAMGRDFSQSQSSAAVNANAKTIARLIPSRDQLKQQQKEQEQKEQEQQQSPARARPRPRLLQKQKFFDQLVLTKQKSFHRLHIQKRDSFAPRSPCGSSDELEDADNDNDDYTGEFEGDCEGAGDIFDQLDRQILEKTLQSRGPLGPQPDSLSATAAAAASLLQVSPLKQPSGEGKLRRPPPVSLDRQNSFSSSSKHSHFSPLHPSTVTSTPTGNTPVPLPRLPDLSAPPPRRGGPLSRVHSLERSISNSSLKPFSPITTAAKQQRDELKMKTLVTPQDKKNALKASKKQDSSKKNNSNRSHKQLIGCVSNHSFKSCSHDEGDSMSSVHPAPEPPCMDDLSGTLYDFVQNMES